MSLIEQEDVLKAINNMIRETESVYVTSALRNFEAVVKDMRTIEPRKKGKWINVRHDNIAECDQCGITGRAWMNFCFDCGADMTEEKE